MSEVSVGLVGLAGVQVAEHWTGGVRVAGNKDVLIVNIADGEPETMNSTNRLSELPEQPQRTILVEGAQFTPIGQVILENRAF